MKPVVFNPVAIDDLDELTNYIAQDNVVAAKEVRLDVFDTADRIGQQPGLGIRPRFSSSKFAGVRFIPADVYPQYLVFYLEGLDEIEVLRVLHGARHLPPLFE